jgi:nucleoside-diphosphate kinase
LLFLFLQITAAQLFHVTRVEAENFLEVYKGVVGNSEYSELTMDLASGPLVAIEVQAGGGLGDGSGCVNRLRELCGPHDVEIARALRPNTLRSRYGVNNVQNAVHCTDLEEDGALESQFFFDIVTKARATAM